MVYPPIRHPNAGRVLQLRIPLHPSSSDSHDQLIKSGGETAARQNSRSGRIDALVKQAAFRREICRAEGHFATPDRGHRPTDRSTRLPTLWING